MEKGSMDEWEEGKQKFLELVHEINGTVEVVIPTKPTNSMFLISLTKGPNRKFITVSEDDIIDLPRRSHHPREGHEDLAGCDCSVVIQQSRGDNVKQLLSGIWQWSWFSEEKQIDFNGLFLNVGEHKILIDPPPMTAEAQHIYSTPGRPRLHYRHQSRPCS